METLEALLDKIEDAYKEYKPWFQFGIPLLIYTLGVLATGIDKSEPGFSLNPFKAVMALFSKSGQSLILLLVLIPILVWMVLKMRGLQHAGMTRDEQRNLWFSDKDTYGTAELMDTTRMKKYFNCVPEKRCYEAQGDILGIKDGLVLSRPADSQHNKHMAVIGASGSMKSRAIVRNKIIGCKRRGESMVITDPKGELFRDTATWLRKSGYNVRALNLVSLEKSSGWNFMMDALGDCKNGEEIEIVDQMAHVIIQNTGGTAAGHSKDDFWDKGEQGLLKAIMLYQFYSWEEKSAPLSFAWAYKFLLENSVDQMHEKFTALNNRKPMNAATSAFNIFQKAGQTTIRESIHFGLLSRLDLFRNEHIQKIIDTDEINLELPAKEKCAYFVITPDQHSTYDFLACLFFTLLFVRLVKYADTQTSSGRCEIPVNIILDEFPNIGEIPDFPKKIATVRSRDINICILFQSLPDLTERYPAPGHFRILNNCDYIIFMGGGDPHTAEYFSERSGEATILADTTSEYHNKLDPLHFTLDQRESVGAGRRMVMTLNEIQTMAKDNPYMELIVMRDQPILQCEKFDYTRDPESQQWEVFAMSKYDPNDDFWKVQTESEQKSAKTDQKPKTSLPTKPGSEQEAPEPAAQSAASDPNPETEAVPDPEPEQPPASPGPNPEPPPAAPEQEPKAASEPPSTPPESEPDPEPPKQRSSKTFHQAQAKSEQNSMDFLKQQIEEEQAEQSKKPPAKENPPQEPPESPQDDVKHKRTPGPSKPSRQSTGHPEGNTEDSLKEYDNKHDNKGLKGTRKAPTL